MTEETAQKIIEILETYTKADIACSIAVFISLIALVAYGILEYMKYKKIKQWRKEFELTLTEEQKKAINQYKELMK